MCQKRVVAIDLDRTILDMGGLFRPVTDRVAEISGYPRDEVNRVRWEVGEITFSFGEWFKRLGIEEARWAELELELRQDMRDRARDCLYPGLRDLLGMLKSTGVRLVLITSGDPIYQRWKFGLLGLDDMFAVEDQHFVPRRASKAEVLRHYLAFGDVSFIDDSPVWLEQVIAAELMQVRLVRPCWPENVRVETDPGDNEHWHVVRTPAELLARLQD